MAELADALDSGSSESNFMQVQVLFPAPQKKARRKRRAFFVNSGNGLEEAVMNQAPVGLENGADRAATSRENPVLFPTPNQYNPNQIFQIGNGFGFFLIFLSQRYNTLDLARSVCKGLRFLEIPAK